MLQLVLILFGCAIGLLACGGDDSSGGGGGTGTGGSATGGSAGYGGTSGGGTAGTASGGNPGSGGGSAGTCPGTAPNMGDKCTDYATCCYGPDTIPYYCVPLSVWEPHPSGRKCCPAAEPTIGGACMVIPYLTCCYGTTAYGCDGSKWSKQSTACS